MPIPNVNRNTPLGRYTPSTHQRGPLLELEPHSAPRRLPVKHFLIAISMNAAI